jgi:ABC-type sugar transport system ATPase subunit
MSEVVLKLEGISKLFNNQKVLNDINLELFKGEVHAIIGENGAGKSTLVKILAGVHKKDSGRIHVFGTETDINSPQHSMSLGISVIFQDSYLFDHFTIAENIFANRLPVKNKFFKFIDKQEIRNKSREILEKLDFPLNINSYVRDLNPAQKRMVEIAKAFCQNSGIIVMDEPTSSISDKETATLFKLIGTLKNNNISVIYLSQRLEDVLKISDRVTILRDGVIQCTAHPKSIDYPSVIKMMSGEDHINRYPKLNLPKGKEVFSVSNLCIGNILKDVSFSLKKGEVLGFAGLVGSGRSELAQAIYGLKARDLGAFYIDGVKVKIKSPLDAIKLGIAYISEDRLEEGLFPNLKVKENMMVLDNFEQNPVLINSQRQQKIIEKYLKKINFSPENMDKQVAFLSGGNQQKIMLTKWFITNSRVFIFNEPTKAIDIPSKVDVYNIMGDLVRKGASLIVVSSDVEELIGICDRILVMHNGEIVKEFPRETATTEKIYRYCVSGK